MQVVAVALSTLLVFACCPRPATQPSAPPDSGITRLEGPTRRSADSRLVAFNLEAVPPPDPRARAAVRLRLRNVSTESLWINSGFSASHRGSGGTVWVDVVDATSGKPLQWLCSGTTTVPDSEPPYILLRPGSEYATLEILECFLGAEAVHLRVVAHYRDVNVKPPRAPALSYWFNGELLSNSVELHVPAVNEASRGVAK